MKKIFTFAFLFFGIAQSFAQTFPVVDLRVSGRKDNRINLVILPDGYTALQQVRFVQNADTIRKNAFKYPPLKEYINFFNAYCIQVPSVDSGVNHPRTATDVTETDPVTLVDNYFGSTFDNGGVHRALVVGKGSVVASVLASNIPDYDLAFVLSNTKMYGGTGGKYATGTMNPASVKIAVHEFGHSFAGLADEYWAGTVFAAEKPNMTANNDPATVKWMNWLGFKKTGIYAHGTAADAKDWYKPHEDCMMEYLDTVLCPVCKQTFVDRIYSMINPIDKAIPDVTTTVAATGASLPFHIDLIKPIPNTFTISWTLNGSPISFSDTFANITDAMLSAGLNELKIFATDTTALSRSYLPGKGYQFSASWMINKSPTGIINTSGAANSGKFFYRLYPSPAHQQAVFEYENTNTSSAGTFKLVDISGRTVQQKDINILNGKNSFPIGLNGINAGIYFVQIQGKDVMINTRLVVE